MDEKLKEAAEKYADEQWTKLMDRNIAWRGFRAGAAYRDAELKEEALRYGNAKYMIDTDETGQKKLKELLVNIDWTAWDNFEKAFLVSVKNKFMTYEHMTPKQKSMVGRLYTKWCE